MLAERRHPTRDELDAVLSTPSYQLHYKLRPGEIIIVNDKQIFHARTPFDDHPGAVDLATARALGVIDDAPDDASDGASAAAPATAVAAEAADAAVPAVPTTAVSTTQDADSSVAGAVMVGLLAARNAGIEVPDKNIDSALDYFKSMTAR